MKNNPTINRAPQLLSAAALFLSTSAAPLAAQTTDSASGSDLEVVELPGLQVESSHLYSDQVNALKTPTPIIDVPQSLSITGSEEIALRGFDSLGDIVDYTPGVSMTSGEAHRDAVLFRGIRSTADFFVDGVRDDVQYYRPLYNVEQVEILRGPNALFFGRGGTGGVLNRVMKKAQLGSEFNAYTFGANTFGADDVQFDTNVGLNESSAFRITAFYENLDNHRDFFDGDRFGINPTFKFALTEKTTLDLSYEYLDHERFIDRGIPRGADNKPVEALKDITFGDPEFNTSTLEGHVFRAFLQHRFSDLLKGNLTTSFGTYDKYYGNYYPKVYDEIGAPDTVELEGYGDQTDRDNFILSGNLIGEFDTGDIEHTLVFGTEFIKTTSDQFRLSPDFGGGSDQGAFSISGRNAPGGFNAGGLLPFDRIKDNTEADLTVYSLFLQDEVQVLEPLTLVLGLRYDKFDIDVTGFDNFGATPLNGSQTDGFVTPRLGFVYKPKKNISLYASYSQTFLPQSGEQFANLGDAGLDPDEFTNLEAGLKWDYADNLSFTTSVFKITQDDIASTGPFTAETRETEIHGFEAQVTGRLTDQWFISAGYSYLDGEDDNGNEPEEIATHTFSIWNRYQLTEKLGFGLGASYQDESRSISGADFVELPSFVRVDAAAYYALSDNLRLQLNIENLFDEVYFPHAHNPNEATVGAPINARLSISGRF